jgi:hypothetical protein
LKFDIDDSQNQSSTDENENEHQQINIPPKEKDDLNDKFSCACSIGKKLHPLSNYKFLIYLFIIF